MTVWVVIDMSTFVVVGVFSKIENANNYVSHSPKAYGIYEIIVDAWVE